VRPDSADILRRIIRDERYQRNVAWGEPRAGHPEGTLVAHIAGLERNLQALRPKLSDDEYLRLKILVHVHDTFKPDAAEGVPIRHPRSHASLARAFLAEFLPDDRELLDIVQFHDEPYALFLRARRGKTVPDEKRWAALKQAVRDWDLFLTFCLVDGSTAGKGREPLQWLFTQVERDGIATRFGRRDLAAPAD
jgi:hypothetical protein